MRSHAPANPGFQEQAVWRDRRVKQGGARNKSVASPIRAGKAKKRSTAVRPSSTCKRLIAVTQGRRIKSIVLTDSGR